MLDAGPGATVARSAPHAPLDLPPEVMRSLPSPCLVVDLAAATHNIAWLAAFASRTSIMLRPHFKAHKCTALARRQVDAGGCSGLTCQTAGEALVLARAGFADILLANETVDAIGLDDLARAAALSNVTTCVDSATGLDALEAAAARHGIRPGVLVEVDVGMGRCGVDADGPELLELATRASRSPLVRFRGLQAYEGHAQFVEDRAARARLVGDAAARLMRARDRLAGAGLACELISGGGTGTHDMAAGAAVWTELQAGSYVLLDTTYARLEGPFRTALYALTTVISKRGTVAILDAGLKTLAVDKGLPRAVDERLTVRKLSDEHAVTDLASDLELAVGDRVWLVPSHVDPTVNLADALFAWSADTGLEIWPVDGRRQHIGG